MKPKVLVLKTDGTNCDEETAFAFEMAGGDSKIVHVNELRAKSKKLNDFHILALPGGFSYGDDIVSGKILAIKLTSFFSEELKKFIERKDTAIIGICNGFQVLIRTGLLPFREIGEMRTTLTNNDSGRFECRWINLTVEKKSKCLFLNSLHCHPEPRSNRGEGSPKDGKEILRLAQNDTVSYQVAHGEGKFFADNKTIQLIEQLGLVAFRYVDNAGKLTQNYPQNPNGSINAIAGICDTTGRILGLMPHPERFVKIEQHPNWRRIKIKEPQGLPIFKNMINFVKNA